VSRPPVLLLGDTGDAGFAALRTRHFAAAVPDAVVVDHREDVSARARALRPRAIVTAGNHGPTRAAMVALAALSGPPAPPPLDAGAARPESSPPLWLDVAGDPFAEAQAAAAYAENPAAVAAEAVSVWAAALARADAFSVVSAPGRHALLGALGVLGRLPLFRPGAEPIHVVPCAAEFPDPLAAPRPAGHGVLLLGGFNTWLDEGAMLAGLLLAMDEAPVQVTVAGGEIAGHHTLGFDRFRAGALASRHAGRFRFVGWAPHGELPTLAAAHHVTVMVDRPGPEPELGARTRVLYGLHLGLRVLATARSPIVAEAVAAGVVEALPEGAAAPAALAAALLAPRPAPPAPRRDAWLAGRSVAVTTAPLRAWAAEPTHAPAAPHSAALAAMSAERDALRAELAAVRASPTFRALDRANRVLRRK